MSNESIRSDLEAVLRESFPDGVIEMPVLDEASWLSDMYEVIVTRLQSIDDAELIWERDPEGEVVYDEGDNPEEDAPLYKDDDSSFYSFFVAPTAEGFTFETDTTQPVVDEDTGAEAEEVLYGEATCGCLVAVSLLGPYAVVKLNSVEEYEDGSCSDPGVEPYILDEDGNRARVEDYYGDLLGGEKLAQLVALQAEIKRVLTESGITVIPDDELAKPADWLKPGEKVFLEAEEITVQDAFFFRGL